MRFDSETTEELVMLLRDPERGERGAAAPPGPPPKSTLRIERRRDGQLWVSTGERECPVRVSRCFPWSEPNRFIALRDFEDEEAALVSELSELDDESREALEQSLAEAGFVLAIERIDAIDEEIEIRCWKVRTHAGARSLQTLREEWPREMPGGGLLIRDVAGDLYHIADPHALDAASQKLLWAYID